VEALYPALQKEGVTARTWDLLTVDNPRKAFTRQNPG
jgi:predicted metal-dependent phosphotriesterase family hydrolase